MTVTTGPTVDTEFDARLERVLSAADGVRYLTFTRADGGELPPWEPGAHVDLLLGPDTVRQYSLCGDPGDRTEWNVAVLRVPDGRGGSRQVHDELDIGATVRLRGPRNTFPLLPAERYVFVAGGIGITPLLPMIADAHARGADWRLVYGGRSLSSMAFRGQLTAEYGDRVTVLPEDEAGRPDLDVLLPEPDGETLVYCCGPEGLLQAVEERAAAWPQGMLHVERFSAQPADDTADGEVEVELALSGSTVRVPAGTSILEALEGQGVQVLSSCREGTCGTCETPVLEGEPEHRDALLTEEERQACDVMMVCVSRARTPRLVLEL